MIRFLLQLPGRIWHSQHRLMLVMHPVMSLLMLYQGNRFISGAVAGASLLYLSDWLAEQWPQTFRHLRRVGDKDS